MSPLIDIQTDAAWREIDALALRRPTLLESVSAIESSVANTGPVLGMIDGLDAQTSSLRNLCQIICEDYDSLIYTVRHAIAAYEQTEADIARNIDRS